ncbi:MAG: hypothetical protein AB7G75_34645 [Candidatus Binatia bacterium]
MLNTKKIALCVCAGLLMMLTAACEQEGPAERAGKQIDEAAENLSDAATQSQGPMEKAGEAVDKAVENAGDAVEQATDR